eukprot:2879053-Amphidinium_carterae.1
MQHSEPNGPLTPKMQLLPLSVFVQTMPLENQPGRCTFCSLSIILTIRWGGGVAFRPLSTLMVRPCLSDIQSLLRPIPSQGDNRSPHRHL